MTAPPAVPTSLAQRLHGLVAACVVVAVATLGLLSGRGEGRASAGLLSLSPAQQPTAATVPFGHRAHVAPGWWSGTAAEVAQDCRGCHDLSPEAGPNSGLDLDLCRACHAVGSRELRDLREGEVARPLAFPHDEHAALECRNCHGPGHLFPAEGASQELPDRLLVPSAEGQTCAQCHGAAGPLILGVGRGEVRDFAGLPPVAGNRAPGLREDFAFDHRDHLSFDPSGPQPTDPKGIADQAAECATCHSELVGPGRTNLSAARFDVEVCVRCHGPGTEFGTSLEPERSSTAATFLHDRHVGKYLNGEQLTCTTCHSYGPRPGQVGTFGLAERFAGDSQSGCVACHADRHIGPHREFASSADECSQCHALAEGSLTDFFELRTSRPTVSVPRPDPSGFSFAVHAHSQLDLGEDCGACHRGQTQGGASDITNRPFDHRSHLAPEILELVTRESLQRRDTDVVREACNGCHREVVQSKGPEAFAQTESAAADPVQEVFDRAACARCHGQQVAVEFELVPTPMLHFSHQDHLKGEIGGRKLDCLDCHRADPEVAAGNDPLTLEVRPEAADCRKCHGHYEGALARVPADLDQASVLKCAYCHTAGVPLPGRGVDVPRQRLTGMMMNVHPHETAQPPPEGRCNDCHLDRLERGPVGRPVSDYDPGARAAGSVTMASVGPGRFFSSPGNNTSPHRPNLAAARRRDFGSNDREFRDILPKAEKTGYSCLYCHWADLDPRDGNPSMIWDKFQLGQAPEVRRNQGAALDADWEPGLRNAQPR